MLVAKWWDMLCQATSVGILPYGLAHYCELPCPCCTEMEPNIQHCANQLVCVPDKDGTQAPEVESSHKLPTAVRMK